MRLALTVRRDGLVQTVDPRPFAKVFEPAIETSSIFARTAGLARALSESVRATENGMRDKYFVQRNYLDLSAGLDEAPFAEQRFRMTRSFLFAPMVNSVERRRTRSERHRIDRTAHRAREKMNFTRGWTRMGGIRRDGCVQPRMTTA